MSSKKLEIKFSKKLNKFYEYNQNNSGGSFTVDDNLCHRLFIEAPSEEEANNIAERLGVYFDGCDKEIDCECCGDRWFPAYEFHEFPLKFSKDITLFNIEDYAQYLADNYGSTSPDGRIFYIDGKVKEIFSKNI